MPYGVGAPLVAGLAERPSVELVRDKPARLITRLRAGELDAALVSSIEAFRRPGYRAIGGLGICCDGPVRSVRAFRRAGGAPLARIGVDDASETSVALLRVLLPRIAPDTVGRDLAFERIEATLRPAELPHDLVLLIGDAGLRADPGDREVIDLGALWRDWTGLRFVFALWLLAPNAPEGALADELLAAYRRGRQTPHVDGGAVHHELGDAELRGLRRFHVEAAACGLAEPDLDVTFVGPLATPSAARGADDTSPSEQSDRTGR